MYNKILIVLGFIFFCASNSANAEKVFAHSKSLKMSFSTQGEPWCKPNVNMQVTADDASKFDTPEYTTIIKKLGHVLTNECPQAITLSITGEVENQTTWKGSAAKADGWLVHKKEASVTNTGVAITSMSKRGKGNQTIAARQSKDTLSKNSKPAPRQSAVKENAKAQKVSVVLMADWNVTFDRNLKYHTSRSFTLDRETIATITGLAQYENLSVIVPKQDGSVVLGEVSPGAIARVISVPKTTILVSNWCTKSGGVKVQGFFKADANLLDETAVNDHITSMLSLLKKKCPKANKAHIYFRQEGKICHHRGRPQSLLIALRYRRDRQKHTWKKMDHFNCLELMQKRKAEEEKLKKRETASKTLFDKFVGDNKIQEWPSYDELSANPFVFENMTVGLRTKFQTMLSKERGIFGKGDLFGLALTKIVIVSDIPKGLFTKKKEVILAGRVLGKERIDLGGGSVLAPHLEFISAHICEDSSCNEMVLWMKNR